MSRRIQAYFRTEDEAEGAKTALIAVSVESLEVGPLTDPLDRGRNILLPLVPLSNTSMTGGVVGSAGAAGSPPAAAIVPGLAVSDTFGDNDVRREGEIRDSTDVGDGDLKDLHYVMDLKVGEEHYHEAVQILRGKHAFVEVFD